MAWADGSARVRGGATLTGAVMVTSRDMLLFLSDDIITHILEEYPVNGIAQVVETAMKTVARVIQVHIENLFYLTGVRRQEHNPVTEQNCFFDGVGYKNRLLRRI
jgi:hypothetical protein